MNILFNNLTFVILDGEGGWRTDLTTRFTEYFCSKLNDGNFSLKILRAATVDEAIRKCQTDYLLIQQGGHIPFKMSFFTALGEVAERNEDIFVGHIVIKDDYATIDKRCIFVNIPLWKENGGVSFDRGKIKDGPHYRTSHESKEKYEPYEIEVVPDAERDFVPGVCCEQGASVVIKQLDTFGKAQGFGNFLEPDDAHFLSTATALKEIRTETEFERLFLPPIKTQIFACDDDDMSEIPGQLADIVVAPAQGLKALNLAEHYHASQVIVFDINPLALELQKKIFSVQRSMTYGEIIEEFLTEYPAAQLIGDWTADRYSIITPLNVDVEYRLIDMFSFQAEDMLRSIDHRKQMIIDFSDIFVYPYNYYHRYLYQVQGLFAELYSLLKSRSGATYILGLAPGFLPMNAIEINTSTARYDWVEPEPVEVEEGEEPPEIIGPEIFKPITSEKVEEKIEEKPSIFKEAEPRRMSQNPLAVATELGYQKSTFRTNFGGQDINATMLSKREAFDDFIVIFEYTVDEMSGAWSFKVGIPDDERRVEFYNGLTLETMKKHLLTDVKINPDTTRKYFAK